MLVEREIAGRLAFVSDKGGGLNFCSRDEFGRDYLVFLEDDGNQADVVAPSDDDHDGESFGHFYVANCYMRVDGNLVSVDDLDNLYDRTRLKAFFYACLAAAMEFHYIGGVAKTF